MRARLWTLGLAAVAGSIVGFAAPASAEFPLTRPAGNPNDFNDLYLGGGQVPNDINGGSNLFKFAATPDPANFLTNANPVELGGVRGASVVDAEPTAQTAFTRTTGRPDVTIAVLDSGIEWDNAGAMEDIRFKTRLSRAELPQPRNDGLATPNEPGQDCSGAGPYDGTGYDLNGDAVFNLLDYSCDNRVQVDSPNGVGPAGMLEPQDILIAFSDGTDADSNGYVDDIAGWDFLDDDNDPFDDVSYGHGTGEARGSVAEADNGGDLGACPNCMAIHLRVGDSFIADVNRFGQAVIYATDNDVQVVQEALGTLNNSSLARHAVNYAYRHGVTVMASAADEAAQHNNWPSTLPHTIVTNSVTVNDPVPVPAQSYLAFNGCTNFSAKITIAIPSTSCSSDAVGLASGYAGLVYSAAYTARDLGILEPYPDTDACRETDGDPCVITPNEVRQLMASGILGGESQVEDVNFAGLPAGSGNEPSCSPVALPGCTSPYGAANALKLQVDLNRPALLGPQVVSNSYPARAGHDQFYGYGRVNVFNAVRRLLGAPRSDPPAQALPPEAEIFSPEWFEPIDPADSSLAVEGEVYARSAPYTCEVLVAPGQYPNNNLTTDSAPGDFASAGNGWCDGETVHSGEEAATLFKGELATIDLGELAGRFPPGTDFTGSIPVASEATANGRPFFAPHAFTFKVVIERTTGPERIGEDRRTSYLHRDDSLLEGYPKAITDGGEIADSKPTADGESSPAFADLDGDNRNELIFAGADGFVHAMKPDGTELDGWPVRSDPAPFYGNHLATRAYESGEVPTDRGGMFLASVAVGDPDGDGVPTVYGADFEGTVYGWGPDGEQVFEEEANPDYSGAPLEPFVNERQGSLNRTGHGFFGSPVLADLDEDGEEELIAASMDRHVYAWHLDDSDPGDPGGADLVEGFPVLVVDPAKVQSIDPDSHQVTYKPDAEAKQQGAIINTPAVGDLDGDGKPEIVVGTNEEYGEDPNASAFNAASLGVIAQTGILDPGNTRLFVLDAEGDRDGDPMPDDAIKPGWPKKMALLLTELLPVVGEGVTGSPVIGPVNCPSGGSGKKIGAQSAAGPAYVFNPDGSSCYGEGPDGFDITLQTDVAGGSAVDHPILPAVGHPIFADFGAGGALTPALITPAAGVIRAADLALPEYQPLGQDFIAAWDPATGQFQPNFPVTMNDLQFLTGPSVADIDGLPGQEMLAGSASQDFAAYTGLGTPVPGWPKLSTDWAVANPLIGTFGTRDTDADAGKVVVMMTRSGYISAFETEAGPCTDSSWPRFHHDNANSGDYERDATLPGVVGNLRLAADGASVLFANAGDDLLCGAADKYEIVTTDDPIDAESFGDATPLAGAPEPGEPGDGQIYELPAGAKRYVAVRAVDEQGNVGRPASVDTRPAGPGPGPEPPPGPTGCDSLQRGTVDDDSLKGTKAAERIAGLGGDDKIKGGDGDDCLEGNGGNDSVNGSRGDDTVSGGSGTDALRGGPGNDTVRGSAGRDTVKGGGGNDRLSGQSGKDRINGAGGDDRINVRGGGRDKVVCGPGKDRVKADRRDRVARNCERVR
jgi:Ca2+-binding RTX toxin-like protein